MNRLTSLLALLAVSTTFAQPSPVPSPADLARERELTQRALGSDYGPSGIQVKLLVGQLPPQPLGPLPGLPSGRLVGSVVRTSSDSDFPNSQTIFFDSSASPAQVRAGLQSALKTLGWTPFKGDFGPSQEGGFQSAEDMGSLAYYRLEQLVSFSAYIGRAGGMTQVTLNLNKNRNLREEIQFRERSDAGSRSNLPVLRPPGGTTVQPSGGGGGGGSWSSFASVQSSLNAVQLLDAYGVQLKAAGWIPLNRSTTGKTVTSLWRFVDQDKNTLTGVLSLQETAPGRYSAQLASLAFRN